MAGIITGIFTILGVLLGFYLAEFKRVNKKITKLMKKRKAYGEPFVIRPNDFEIEKQQMKEREKERIDLKEILS